MGECIGLYVCACVSVCMSGCVRACGRTDEWRNGWMGGCKCVCVQVFTDGRIDYALSNVADRTGTQSESFQQKFQWKMI